MFSAMPSLKYSGFGSCPAFSNGRTAIGSLEKAKQFDENNVETLVNLGYAYSRQNRYRKAIAEIQKVVSLKPADVEAQFFLGNLYLQEKDKQSALAQYKAVRLLNPQLAQMLYQAICKDKIIFVSNK